MAHALTDEQAQEHIDRLLKMEDDLASTPAGTLLHEVLLTAYQTGLGRLSRDQFARFYQQHHDRLTSRLEAQQ